MGIQLLSWVIGLEKDDIIIHFLIQYDQHNIDQHSNTDTVLTSGSQCKLLIIPPIS